MININQPYFPPIEEYIEYIKSIWDKKWLTNAGPLANELEIALKKYLSVSNVLFLTNGTIALQIAIKALELKGEIITTPFSFVATTTGIIWEGCTPVFVDIDEDSLNIDPEKIEQAITSKTSAILATHVYGNPCDIEKIDAIAAKYNLRVIYDAAHCFGTQYKGKSVFEYGDISTASFHATKVFHTGEGGAVFAKDPSLVEKMDLIRNFGFDGPYTFREVGINGKNSELHAAMGLVNLRHVDTVLKQRKELSDLYSTLLTGLNIRTPLINPDALYNYAYYPVVFETEETLLKNEKILNEDSIYPRRYFYPGLNSLSYIKEKQEMPVCDSIASRVLCLPLYHALTREDVSSICSLLKRVQNV